MQDRLTGVPNSMTVFVEELTSDGFSNGRIVSTPTENTLYMLRSAVSTAPPLT